MKRWLRTIFILMVFFFTAPQNVLAAQLLIPGGQLVGLELTNDTVTVAAFDDSCGAAAREAGLQIGDQLLSVDGRDVTSAEDVRRALRDCGDKISLTVLRGSKKIGLTLAPARTNEGKRLGVYLRQGIAGVGTVTFYDPESNTFGTLGHGVSDSGGNLLKSSEGRACDASVASVKKGKAGDPGQLRGNADGDAQFGQITKNTPHGVFGESRKGITGEPLPIAAYADVHTGPATIRSTVEGDTIREYSVEIMKIYPEDRPDGRNFLIKVTDPALLKSTGGIVQGMGVSYNRDNTGTLKSLQGLGDSPGFSLTKINPCTCAGTQGRTSFVSSDQAIRMKYIERRFSKPSILFKQPYIILPHRIRHRAVSVTLFGAFLFDMITDWRKI